MKKLETEVIVVGGGATGCGILRDLSLRNVKAILIEKQDLANGATGGNHGLLHSGARYAVHDHESAVECIHENMILKKVARHCVEDTGGLFIALKEDMKEHGDFPAKFQKSCRTAGIPCQEISPNKAFKLEPNINHDIETAFRVPDGGIDPFRLTSANILDAKEHGAEILTYTEVLDIIKEGNEVKGVRCKNLITGEIFEIYAKIVVNATASWGRHLCEMAGAKLNLLPSKGSLIIMDYRINDIVVNRCRRAADADIIVPADTVSIIGTTSITVPDTELDNLLTTDEEIDTLIKEGSKLIPAIKERRIIRAFSGVRPLISLDENGDGRNVSRGIVLIDHAEKDNIENFITISGGKLMTYRLMAEKASDLVCQKLKINKSCETANQELPGSKLEKKALQKMYEEFTGIPRSVVGPAFCRHGQRTKDFIKNDKKNNRIVCECEMVTEGEIEYAINKLNVKNIKDLRKRTRVGAGPCQGEVCAFRAASLFPKYSENTAEDAILLLKDYLEERWKGMTPVMWNDTLREAEYMYCSYEGVMRLGKFESEREA